MTGQLVLAELGAFRAILRNAQRADREKVRSWCRSTITNALHRVGPTELMKTAAERASTRADVFASALADESALPDMIEHARDQAVEALDRLVTTVRGTKGTPDPRMTAPRVT